jgi:hypothetical protein
LLVCAVSVVAAVELLQLAKVSLLDAGFGPTTLFLTGSTPPAVVPFAAGEVALGFMGSHRVGVGLGTSVVAGDLLSDISFLPVRGCLFYDFSPGQRWRMGTGFLSATYVHNGDVGFDGSAVGPYLKLKGGISYTYYAVTPHAELGYDFHERFATVTAGVAIGGTYISR